MARTLLEQRVDKRRDGGTLSQEQQAPNGADYDD
jgi:hypothetical protein